ncbi:membrane protein [Methylopila jiangsuensis]|uniref:Membrane protein n=1 Tax=Methylopila jiangsuensis TaxID=586230 RepID=A0A9W6JJ41_9HYPH|nr:AsmA family protein [Methylopila jiangsuensis]MDR6284664.1 hypothetical protein [Methylopila jiangsuensis]GLK77947.1 membrane protein [Methylopila jiangsuensis]
MNNTLTALGLALVLALAAALVGPLFVDWSAYRDEVARQAGALLGAPATVAGPVDVRLLPSPYLRVRGLSAGAGDGRLLAEEVELTLSVGALLRRDLNAERVRLVRPRLLLSVGADGAVTTPVGAGAGAGAERISFSRAEIEDGRVELSAPAGRVTLSAVSGFAEAGSLKGPFRFEGRAVTALGPATLRLSTARADAAGALRLKLSATLDGRPETLDLDGALTLAKQPRFDGQIVLARPPARDDATTPWRAAAKIAGDAGRLALSALDLRRGPEDKALKLGGEGALTLSPKPRLALALDARQLDLDRTAPGVGDGAASRFAALGDALSPFSRPPLDIGLTLDLGSVVAAGDVARSVALDLSATGGEWRLNRAEALLPGGTRVSARGAVAVVGDGAGFAGPVTLETDDLPALRRWLRGGPEAQPGLRRLALSGALRAHANGFALDDARLTADGGQATGRVAWREAEPGGRSLLELALTADRLDLDAPGLDELRGALAGGGDVAVAIDARELKAFDVAFSGVSVDAAYDRDGLDLRRLAIGDAGGARLSGAGRLTLGAATPEGDLAFDIAADRFDGLLALARAAGLSSPMADALGRRAAPLAPATLALDLHIDPDGAVATLKGEAADGPLDARLAAARPAWDAEAELSLALKTPEGARLAALAGLPRLSPAARDDGGALTLSLKGPLNGTLRGDVSASALGVEAAASGTLNVPAATAEGTARLMAQDAATLLEAFGRATPGVWPAAPAELRAQARYAEGGLAFDGLSGRVGGRAIAGRLEFSAAGALSGELALDEAPAAAVLALALGHPAPGAATKGSIWPAEPFGPPPLAGLDGRVAVTLKTLTLAPGRAATDARFTLAARPTSIAIEDLAAGFAGGRLTGALSASRAGADATLALKLALADADPRAASAFGPVSPVSGRAELTLDLQGSGRSPRALVASLAGAGTATLRDGAVARLDPAAPGQVEPLVENGLALETATIAAALEPLLGKSDLAAPRVTAAFSVSGGVARSGPIESARGDLGGAAALDLSRLALDADLLLGPRASPTPPLGVSFEGPLVQPVRRLDAAALTGWLSVRAVERETRRIEALEAEMQERARLARERAAAEERRRAEEKRRQDEERQRREAEEREKAAREAEERARAAAEQPAPELPARPDLSTPPAGSFAPR